jgi:hypothetical protein
MYLVMEQVFNHTHKKGNCMNELKWYHCVIIMFLVMIMHMNNELLDVDRLVMKNQSSISATQVLIIEKQNEITDLLKDAKLVVLVRDTCEVK